MEKTPPAKSPEITSGKQSILPNQQGVAKTSSGWRKLAKVQDLINKGKSVKAIAKESGIPRSTIRYWVKQGYLTIPKKRGGEKAQRGAAAGVAKSTGSASDLFIPHRFGVSFFIKKQPTQWIGWSKAKQYPGWRQFHFGYEKGYTATVYIKKVVFWLKCFEGTTVKQRIQNGVFLMRQKARQFQREQDCQLVFDRLIQPVEWVVEQQQLSDYIGKALDLENKSKVIADATFLYDKSHPGKVEINKYTPGGSPVAPSEAAEKLEWFIQEGKGTITDIAGLQHATLSELRKIADSQNQIVFTLKGFYKDQKQ